MRNDIAVAVATLHALIDGKLAATPENFGDILDSLLDLDAKVRGLRSVEGPIVEAAPNAMVVVNGAGRIVLVNAQTERLFGYAREELLGTSVERLVPERFRSGHGMLRGAYSSAATARPMGAGRELFGCRKDGSEMPIEIGLNPLTLPDGPCVLASIIDISERKRGEALRLQNAAMSLHADELEALNRELESASRFKSQFVATMSHELRTPLTSIIGMAELLRKSRLDEAQVENIDTINEAAEALLAVINSILDFSKIEAGKVELRDASFSVKAVVEGAADVLAQEARKKGVALYTYIDARIPPLRGDADRVRQILLNLIGNAVKFTGRGHVVVRVASAESSAERVTLRFEIEDTGIGLAAPALRRLFEPFVQADGSASRTFGGTGLGLSISKRLVELMNGEIGVRSEPGTGSLFWFTARLVPAAVPPVQRAIEDAIAYVVSDDELLVDILGKYLGSWGVLSRRTDPAAVVADLRESPRRPRVAILDRDTQSGRRALEALRSSGEDFDARTVVLGRGRLMKPLRQSQLFEAIVAAIDPGGAQQAAPISSAASQLPAGRPVLVAEDNARLQKLLRLQFDDLGVPVSFVADGVQVLEALDRERFALVFMDCHMPNMDGLEATRVIRARERRTGGRLPIVAMTANAFAEDRDLCIAAGMDDYLAKPVKINDLREMIVRWARPSGAGLQTC
jgi:PAS domain S-box-containing protein